MNKLDEIYEATKVLLSKTQLSMRQAYLNIHAISAALSSFDVLNLHNREDWEELNKRAELEAQNLREVIENIEEFNQKL